MSTQATGKGEGEHPLAPSVRLDVENFGPIGAASVDLRPLTVFVGPSNTGKTYLATLIYALRSSLEGFANLPHSLFGPHSQPRGDAPQISEESMKILLRKLEGASSLRFNDLPEQYRIAFTKGAEKQAYANIESDLLRCFDVGSIVQLNPHYAPGKMRVAVEVCQPPPTDTKLWQAKIEPGRKSLTASLDFGNIDILLGSTGQGYVSRGNYDYLFSNLYTAIEWGLWHNQKTDATYYLPATRGGVMQSHQVIVSSLIRRATRGGIDRVNIPTLPGAVADFLETITSATLPHPREKWRRPNEHTALNDAANYIEDEILMGKIVLEGPDTLGRYQHSFLPERSKEHLAMTRVSSMVSELAPLVHLLRRVVRRGATLIIDEPEAHLHPGAQVKMASALAMMVRAGLRVILTTHSEWLLDAVNNLVRKGLLRSASDSCTINPYLYKTEVGAWKFNTGKPGAGSTVSAMEFDIDSGFDPEDYSSVAQDINNDSATLRDELRHGEQHNV